MQEERTEVRYHMLRPGQIVKRRTECPVVYIPTGNLEWHGVQNPVGADTLQAEGIAMRCARKGGGLVFPPLYYGDSRLEALMEVNAPDKDQIAAGMDLPPENFAADKAPFPPMEQALNYHKLLLHVLAEAEALGFGVGVIVTQHYPLIDHARAAVLQFNQRRYSKSFGMLAWAFMDAALADYPYRIDHGGAWETSHMMALNPETVDLEALPSRGEYIVGTAWDADPHDATAAFGNETLDCAVEIAVKEVRHRLENRQMYNGHGRGLLEGLWRESAK
jgi:creatinine amidohydrolase